MSATPARPGIVNAAIAGTQKGGTSALSWFLAKHPRVSAPSLDKEMHFFDDDARFAGGPVDYAEYEALVGERAGADIRLDCTPSYMWSLPAAPRIAAYNPGMKLIMILRDPVSRAISQWEMNYGTGVEPELFEAAVEREQELLRRAEQVPTRSYLSRGFYGVQVRRLLQHFPRGQMLFLTRYELLKRHADTLMRVYRFLGIPAPSKLPKHVLVYPRSKRFGLPKVSEETRKALRKIFIKDLSELQELTGLDTRMWREDSGISVIRSKREV